MKKYIYFSATNSTAKVMELLGADSSDSLNVTTGEPSQWLLPESEAAATGTVKQKHHTNNASTMIDWKIRHYSELSKDELYEILRLRAEVFVVEQTCPYQDLDGLDDQCHHIMGWKEDRLIAYARVLPEGVDPYELVGEGDGHHGGIGRVVVATAHRGIGHELMDRAIEAYISIVGKDVPCIIHAQAHLKHFYEAHGFRQSSGICIIDGIDHIEMTRI